MGCPFCAIVAGEAEASVVLRTPHATAFLDARPLFKGHTLVVPTAHVETLTDLPVPAIAGYFAGVQSVARAVQQGCGAQGTFVAMNNIVSQSVPHLHAHVVPRTKGDGLRGFFWPRTRYESNDERDAWAAKISAALAADGPARSR